MALTQRIIDEASARYRREYDRYLKLSLFVADKTRRLIEDNAIRATVQWRAKDPRGLENKLRKYMADATRSAQYDQVDDVFRLIKDLAGVRVTTYVESDRDKVVQQVQDAFAGLADDGAVAVSVKDSTETFYRATHCQVVLQTEELVGVNENLDGTSCEIQVCSLLAHVWNEIEHDLAYKPLTGVLSDEERNALDALARITQGGDDVVNGLLMANARRLLQVEGAFVDVHDFVVRMRERFPDAINFSANAGQLYEELLAEGLDSPQAIQPLLGEDPATTSSTLIERLRAHLTERGDDVVAIDGSSSDRLLMMLLLTRAESVLTRHPAGRGQGRPPRIASVARRFLEMPDEESGDDGSALNSE